MFPNRGLWAIWRLLIGMDLCRYVRPQFAHVSLPSNLFCSRLAFSFQLTSSHNIHTQTHTYIIHTIGFPLTFHLVNEEKADSNVITQSHDRRQCILACRLCIVTGFSPSSYCSFIQNRLQSVCLGHLTRMVFRCFLAFIAPMCFPKISCTVLSQSQNFHHDPSTEFGSWAWQC